MREISSTFAVKTRASNWNVRVRKIWFPDKYLIRLRFLMEIQKGVWRKKYD